MNKLSLFFALNYLFFSVLDSVSNKVARLCLNRGLFKTQFFKIGTISIDENKSFQKADLPIIKIKTQGISDSQYKAEIGI